MSFSEFGLDRSLVRALEKLEFTKPTAIQDAALPVLLSLPRDALIKSPTGSGKTLLYVLTILQTLFECDSNGCLALILVPTRELVSQVQSVVKSFIEKAKNDETAVIGLNGKETVLSLKNQLETLVEHENPKIIYVSTPSSICKLSFMDYSRLKVLVMDEADLLLSFGYEKELNMLLKRIVNKPQTLLVSATLNSSLDDFKRLCLKNPAIIRLEDEDVESPIGHYSLIVSSRDKPLLLLALLKLNLLESSKTLLFTNSLETAYKLRLFLETFGLKSVVFHPKFPAVTRVQIIEQVNKGKYSLVICIDDDAEMKKSGGSDDSHQFTTVSRGIDFKNVPIVINYEVPSSQLVYSHRVGRTGRATTKGLGLTLVDMDKDTVPFHALMESTPFSSFDFDISKIEGFRYRVDDILASITKNRIKEAQVKDLKQELAAHESLKLKYDTNPKKLLTLYHLDGQKDMNLLNRQLCKRHLKVVPDYLLMNEGNVMSVEADSHFVEDLAQVKASFKKHRRDIKNKKARTE